MYLVVTGLSVWTSNVVDSLKDLTEEQLKDGTYKVYRVFNGNFEYLSHIKDGHLEWKILGKAVDKGI